MTTQITISTDHVLPDEKAYWISESFRAVPGMGYRRIQRIQVLRNDKVVVYEEDMGPWDMLEAHPFQAPSFWEYSVAELREIALQAREQRPVRDPDDHIDLIAVWARDLDERQMRRDHRSTIGPYFRKERR